MHRMVEYPPGFSQALKQDVFVMPCSTGQRRFWMLEQICPGNTALVIPIALQLSGPLQVEILERALNAMVSRHEILRTHFELVDGEPMQIIAPEAELKLRRIDLRQVPADEYHIEEMMAEEAKRPVALTEAPLLRATLVQLPKEAVLMLTAHHIISDGWSNGVMVRELGAFYRAFALGQPVDLPPLTIQYADYVLWQEEWLKTPEFAGQLAYWNKELQGEIPALDFPTDFARRGGEAHEAVLESRLLPAPLTEALKRLCGEGGITLFMVFFSAYLVLLHRYTGQTRLIVGTTGANRNKPELENLVGLFSNLLLLRRDVSGGTSFRDFLTQQRDHLLDNFAQNEAPFERVLEQMQAEKNSGPIQAHFLFQKAFMQPTACGDLAIRPLYSVSPGSTFELTFGIVERAEGIRLQMEYRTSLFRKSTITRLLRHFQALLESIVENPETDIGDLSIFAENEREELECALRKSQVGGAVGTPDPAAILQELDRQIEEHFRNEDSPFTPKVLLPARAALVALDERRRLLPVGIPGDLYLASREGSGATVSGPVDSEVSMPLLKTGFVGRNAEGGGVELAGRAEDLIGLPTFRCNRRAAEVRLRFHPEVREAVVVVDRTAGGASKLIAYVVLVPDAKMTGPGLRAFLREEISDLLVPCAIFVVPSFPRDPSGKIMAASLQPTGSCEKKACADSFPLRRILHQQLIEIWREILKTPEIGLDDNFFEIGGNSFLALRMMTEAGRLCRRTLPLSLLLTGATVANLARFIVETNAEAETTMPLIPVQENGTRRAVYFLHGDWVGGGFYCNRLSQELGAEQPFYALPPHRAGRAKILSITEMAALHCAAIREHSPHGPYVLGGYCIGALVAMDAARQLIAEGEEVAHLFLVDPPVLADRWLRWAWPWFDRVGKALGWGLEKRIGQFDHSAVPFNRWLKRPLKDKWSSVRNAFGGRGRVKSGGGKVSAIPADSSENEMLSGLDYALYFLAYRTHTIKPLSVPATLFMPESTPADRLSRVGRASKIDPAQYTIEMVPGDHTTCVTQDNFVLAEKMRAVLERL